jgi:hypothetical protein
MLLSSVAFAALLGLASPVPPGAPAAAVTTKYKLEIKSETTIDLSMMGQGTQTTTANLTTWLAITMSDSAGGKSMRAVLDSVAFSGTAPIPQSTIDSAGHAEVRGFVDATGQVKGLTARPSDHLLVGQVQGMLNSFFPKMKAAAKLGDSWLDTTEIQNAGGGNNTHVTLIINYTSGGPESRDGLAATKVSAATKSTITGTLENAQVGTMEVEGAGTGTGTFFMGVDGRLLGGTSSSTMDQRLKISMAPTPIPVKTVQTVTVTLIK